MDTNETQTPDAPSTELEATPKPSLKDRFTDWKQEHPFATRLMREAGSGAVYGVAAFAASAAAAVAFVALNPGSDEEVSEENTEE